MLTLTDEELLQLIQGISGARFVGQWGADGINGLSGEEGEDKLIAMVRERGLVEQARALDYFNELGI